MSKIAEFLRCLVKAKTVTAPVLMRNRVKAAWLWRWSSVLACSAARAFALSLLEKRPHPSTGVNIPFEQEVFLDDRFG